MALQQFVFTVICGRENENDCPGDSQEFKQKIKDGAIAVTHAVETSGNVETVTLDKIYFYESPPTMIDYDREIYMGLATVTNGHLIFTSQMDNSLAPGDDLTPSGETVLQDFFAKVFLDLEIEGIGGAWQLWMVVPLDQATPSVLFGPGGGVGH